MSEQLSTGGTDACTNKPFTIQKRGCRKRIRPSDPIGAAGVDEQTIEQFEGDLKGNLYKVWNRMAREATFLRRSAPSQFRKRTEE